LNKIISEIEIRNHITSIYKDHSINVDSLNQALTENVFFVTAKFDGVTLGGSRSDPSSYLAKFADWYHSTMQISFGRHLGRKRTIQPITYAFIDFPGSRNHRQSSDLSMSAGQRALSGQRGVYDHTRYQDGRADFLKCDLLHVHAVMALVPDKGQACRVHLTTPHANSKRGNFGDVEISPFDPALGSLDTMIEYAMKGAVRIGSHYKSDCWTFLPK
jgi:hypothetical protein